jgi:hypothetical protein
LSALGVLRKNPELFSPPLPAAKPASMKNLVFGVVNKIFLSYEAPFLNPEISEIIVLWNKIDESATPMAERWFRKIYSFCKGDISHPESLKDRLTRFFLLRCVTLFWYFHYSCKPRQIKREKDIYHRGPRPITLVCYLPSPRCFSLVTTFKLEKTYPMCGG